MTEWYYEENGQSVGPVDEDHLKRLAFRRRINPDTLIWQKSFGRQWKAIGEAGIKDIRFLEDENEPPPLPGRAPIAHEKSPVSSTSPIVLAPSLCETNNAPTDLTRSKEEEFLASPITDILISKNINFYKTRWFSIIKRSYGDLNKPRQVVSWNTDAAFLSVYWLLYRKMYKAAAIIIAIDILLIVFGDITRSAAITIHVVIAITLGIYGNSLYLNRTFIRFDEINKTSDRNISEKSAFQNGGTSWVSVVIGFLVYILVITGVLIYEDKDQVFTIWEKLFTSGLSCSSEDTLDLVRQITKEKLGKEPLSLFGIDANKSEVVLSAIRTRESNRNIVKCAAHIQYKLHKPTEFGELAVIAKSIEDKLSRDIAYTVENTDNNEEIYVTVSGS
jgi:hypothetical protein